MRSIENGTLLFFQALENIRNSHFVIPAFQRQFEWEISRIEKLWDSILLDYPFSTFLFWHIDDSNTTCDTYFMSFLSSVTFNSRNQARGENNNYSLSSIDTRINDTAIIDGQQRLTALYVSLYGDLYIRKKNARKKDKGGIVAKLFVELNNNKLTVDEEEYNSKKYDIKFNTKLGMLSPTLFEIKKLMDSNIRDEKYRNELFESYVSKVPENSKDYARSILNKLYSKIYEEKLIHYTEIIGMNQDDALEMFVRFNSGGKALKKSDITMSILEAYWPQAKNEFGKILVGDYSGFDTDFIIRTALMLYGDVIKPTINKNLANQLHANWNNFKDALKKLSELLKKEKINISRFNNGWNVLLPII